MAWQGSVKHAGTGLSPGAARVSVQAVMVERRRPDDGEDEGGLNSRTARGAGRAAASRSAGARVRRVSDGKRPGPSWKIVAYDVTGSQNGARQVPGATGWGSTADREDTSLPEGELEEESDGEPEVVPPAVENAMMAGGGPIPRQPGKRPSGLPSVSSVCVPGAGGVLNAAGS